MPVAAWSSTASSNTEVGGLSTDGTIQVVSNIDAMFRGMMADIATARDDGTMTTYAPRGYLHGLTLSNNVGDAVNDLDIAVGECAADTSPYRKLTLASAITKRLDAGWAVGSNQGGLDTGSIADGTYHIWLIQRSDTGVVDALFSTSATAPTMPTNYDRKRRIGSIIREAATIIGFHQKGDKFKRRVSVTPYNSTAAVSPPVLRLLSVPDGIVVEPIMQVNLVVNPSSNAFNTFGDAENGTAGVTVVQNVAAPAGANATSGNWIEGGFFTDTSRQLYHGVGIPAGTISSNTINMWGWIDTRGRV
ncbi:hypothetical protein [Phyllobacterium sp. 22552]|uniref:hypothetical protein n=1 Tax=Phyllobacterium sp. 22552 TaxID=3453941 RepID=UPI003F8645E0